MAILAPQGAGRLLGLETESETLAEGDEVDWSQRPLGKYPRGSVLGRPSVKFTVDQKLEIALEARVLDYLFFDQRQGRVHSIVLAVGLLVMGFQTLLIAFVADLCAARKRLEAIRDDIKRDAKEHRPVKMQFNVPFKSLVTAGGWS